MAVSSSITCSVNGTCTHHEPAVAVESPTEGVLALVRTRAHLEFERSAAEQASNWAEVADLDDAIGTFDEALSSERMRGRLTPTDRTAVKRKTRSTKRRQDVPELPRMPVENRTVGRSYAGRAGRTYRPSMLLTTTLGSYGPVHTSVRRGSYLVPCECGSRHYERDPLLGTPLDPDSYDYRHAALDAIHFAKVLDRFWQNLIGSEPASTGWDRSAHGRLWQNSALEVLAAGWRVEPIGFQPSRWRSTGALAGASSSHLAWVILRGSTSFTVVV